MSINGSTVRETNPLVFLDIDGVLNGHQFCTRAQSSIIDQNCVREFNLLLAEAGADYVVSSSWRYMIFGGAMTEKGFEYLLQTHGVQAGRMVGITASDEECPGREAQILDYIAKHPGREYLVLDDLDLKGLDQWFVRTDGAVGLTEAKRVEALNVLFKRQYLRSLYDFQQT